VSVASLESQPVQGQGFGKEKRLLTPGDYQRVFKQSSCIRSPEAKWYVRKIDGQGRLGLVLAKRAIKKSVDRNRIKRLLRESFRHHAAVVEGCEIIFIAQHPIQQLDNKRIFEILDSLWLKLSRRAQASSR